ncbi:HI1506-related protein [Pseudaeromonas pectinilytica]
MVKFIPIHVVSVAHTGYLRAGVRLDAGVNEITVSPGQLAAMEADPRLVVTVLAAPENDAAADDAPPKGGVDSGLDGSGVVVQKSLSPFPSHYAPVLPTLTTGTLGGVMEQDGTVKSLDDMSQTALKALAKDLEIKGYTSMDKPALVAAIAATKIQYDASEADGKKPVADEQAEG